MADKQRIEEAKAVINKAKRAAMECDEMVKEGLRSLIASYEAMGVEMERTMNGRVIMAASNEKLAIMDGKPAGYYQATEIDKQWDTMVKEWKIKAAVEADKVKNIKRYNDELLSKADKCDLLEPKKKDLCLIM